MRKIVVYIATSADGFIARPSFLIFLLLISVATVYALKALTQDQGQDCPRISVTCLDAGPGENAPIRFNASVTGGQPTSEVSYCWTITRGTIKKGQGTAEIEIEAKGADRKGLTATVDIGGFDPKCGHTASCSTMVR